MLSQTVSPANTQWWRIDRVIEETGLSRSTIYRLMSAGDFPKNRAMRRVRAKLWLESDVRRWKEEELIAPVESGLGDLL